MLTELAIVLKSGLCLNSDYVFVKANFAIYPSFFSANQSQVSFKVITFKFNKVIDVENCLENIFDCPLWYSKNDIFDC